MVSNDSTYPKSFGQTPKPIIQPNYSPDSPNQLTEVYSIWGRNGFLMVPGFFGGGRDLIPSQEVTFRGVEQSWKVAPSNSNFDNLQVYIPYLRPDFHYGHIFIGKYENRNGPWTDLNIHFQIGPGVSWGSFTIGAIKKKFTPTKKSFLKNNLTPYPYNSGPGGHFVRRQTDSLSL